VDTAGELGHARIEADGISFAPPSKLFSTFADLSINKSVPWIPPRRSTLQIAIAGLLSSSRQAELARMPPTITTVTMRRAG
jgi:hypothetical protein